MPVEPLAESAFIAALRGLSGRYWGTHPFHHRLHAGELDAHGLRIWAANRWYYQCQLPQKDAAIIANCPLPEIRRQWLDRIVYHDGPRDVQDTFMRVEGQRRMLLNQRLTLQRFGVEFDVWFSERSLHEEGAVERVVELLKQLGHVYEKDGAWWMRTTDFGDDKDRVLVRSTDGMPAYLAADLAYFTNRIDKVSGEGKDTLDIVVRHCVTREQQGKAIAALSFKCDVLWSMLDAIERAAG